MISRKPLAATFEPSLTSFEKVCSENRGYCSWPQTQLKKNFLILNYLLYDFQSLCNVLDCRPYYLCNYFLQNSFSRYM